MTDVLDNPSDQWYRDTERKENETLLNSLCKACIERAENCPDYGKGKKTDDMALNFFVGAANFARATRQKKVFDMLQIFLVYTVALHGMRGVRQHLAGK